MQVHVIGAYTYTGVQTWEKKLLFRLKEGVYTVIKHYKLLLICKIWNKGDSETIFQVKHQG